MWKRWLILCFTLKNEEFKFFIEYILRDLFKDWCDVTLGLVGGCLEDLRAEGGWDGALDWVSWFNKQNENDSRNKH